THREGHRPPRLRHVLLCVKNEGHLHDERSDCGMDGQARRPFEDPVRPTFARLELLGPTQLTTLATTATMQPQTKEPLVGGHRRPVSGVDHSSRLALCRKGPAADGRPEVEPLDRAEGTCRPFKTSPTRSTPSSTKSTSTPRTPSAGSTPRKAT